MAATLRKVRRVLLPILNVKRNRLRCGSADRHALSCHHHHRRT
jgi:hypothetical protein